MQHATKKEERPLLTTVPPTPPPTNPVPEEEQEQPPMLTIGKQALAQLNTARAKLVEFQKNYTPKKLAKIVKDWQDKEGRERLRQILAEMRGTRVGLEKARKAGVKEVMDRLAAFKANYLEVEDAIEVVEAGGKKLKEQLEQDEIDAARREEAERAERTSRRTDRLNAAGAYFDGRFYAVGGKYDVPEVSIGMADIEVMSDLLFEGLEKRVMETAALMKEKAFAENARMAEEKEQERQRELERQAQERLQKEQEKQKQEQERLALEAEKLRQQQAAQELFEQNQKLQQEKERIEREKQELYNSRVEIRSAIVEAWGMKKVNIEYVFGKSRLSLQALGVMDNEKWSEVWEYYKKQITEEKQMMELRQGAEQQLLDLGMEPDKKTGLFYFHDICFGISDANLIANTWQKQFTDVSRRIAAKKVLIAEQLKLKQVEDSKKLQAQLSAQRQEKLLLAADKDVWDEFSRYIAAIRVPTEFKSHTYQEAAAMAKEKLEEILQLGK